MIVRQRFDGRDQPFEGERHLTLGNIPAGAKVLHARAVLSPVLAEDGAPPVETLAFAGQAWGATRVRRQAVSGQPGWVEVDFHSRRTLHSVAGTGLGGSTLEIDLGGAFAAVKDNGTLLSPSDPAGAALTLTADDEILPGLTVGRFRLSHATASPDLSVVRVRGVPRNVSLGLGAEPPFFTAPGELSRAATVEDFTAALTTFLAGDEPVEGFHRVPLVLRSDALGRVDVAVEIELLEQGRVLPAGLDEITVPYAYGETPEGSHGKLEVALPPGVRVRATEGKVVGAFEASRVLLGPTGEVPADPPSVPLAPDRAQAQRLVLAERLEASAVDLLLAAVSRRARLELDLLEDLDGKPGGASRLPRPAAFTLERETAGGPTWVSVPLGAAVQLEAQDPERSWLAVRVLEGEALWFVEDGGPAATGGLQSTTDGALSWRRSTAEGVAAPTGLFRLRRVPETFEMPVALQVGSGAAARRVSFASQEARGRVELDLGLPELADAFNGVLADGAAACPQGELLDNPEFERWFSLGDALGALETVDLGHDLGGLLSRVAASPDGRWAYLVTGFSEASTTFQTIDLVCRQVGAAIRLSFAPPVGLAVHPAGHRAYVALSDGLQVIDLATSRLLGSVPVHRLSSLALSPDGERLFFASETEPGPIAVPALAAVAAPGSPRIDLVATDRLEAAALGGPAAGDPFADPDAPRATPAGPVLDLAVSADGSRLFALERAGATRATPHRLQVFDAQTLASAAEGVAVAPGTEALASSPDGRWLVTVDSGGSLELRDPETLGKRAEIPVPEGTRRIALEPGGRRAFATTTGRVSVVDLERRRQVQSLHGRGASLSDLAVTPDGGHLVVARAGLDQEFPDTLQLIPIGSALPEEWAVTGPVSRACLAQFGSVLVLGVLPDEKEGPEGPFGLSQVTPVAPGCRYELTLEGVATVDDAQVELTWISDGCRPAETTRLPVPRAFGEPRTLPRSSRLLSAPSAARQAEVRLRLPEGAAAVARLSLVATADVLDNGLLQPAPGGPPAGWELEPPGAAGFTARARQEGGVLLGSATSAVSLAQTVEVEPGRLFELGVSSVPSAFGAAAAGATIALAWSSAAGASVGDPLEMSLAQAGSEPLRARGTVPAEAATARLELRLPAGARVAIERIAFALREPRTAAAVFLAQAPGELRIRDWRVAYEPAEPARLPVPEGGLCAPTPPGSEPGEACEEEPSCPRCKAGTGVSDGETQVTAAGRVVTVGRCTACGAPRMSFTGGAAPRAARFTPRSLPAVQPPGGARKAPTGATSAASARLFAAPGRAAAATVRKTVPLTAVEGIAAKRAATLRSLGIDSIEKLAQADPARLEGRLPGAASSLVRDLIVRARQLVG